MHASATRELNRDWKRNKYSAGLVGIVQYEHDEYFQSKKNGEARSIACLRL